MKKAKQIFALLGVILLLVLYGSTIYFALTDNSNSMRAFEASVVATILIPVLLWAYTFVYRMVKGHPENNITSEDTTIKNK